jgi:SAM-dependent methyltransferase
LASEPIQPTTIQALLDPVPKAYALLTGMQLDLFTALHDGPLTIDDLADAVRGDVDRLSRLVFFLVSTGLLTVSDGRFANSAEADRWLVRGRPGAVVNRVGFLSDMYRGYSMSAESIRAGRALAKHDYTVMSPEELTTAFRSFDLYARPKGAWLARTFDFATCRTLVDVGGGSGGLAVVLTERFPHISATVADLPSVLPVTEQFLAEAGATSRVQTLGIDLVAQPLPGSFDVAVLSNFVQVLDPAEASQAVRHVGAAIRPGGLLYVVGHVLEDTRRAPLGALSFNFMAISLYERGQAYTESQHRTWLEDAGFGEVEFRWDTLPELNAVVIIARKQG